MVIARQPVSEPGYLFERPGAATAVRGFGSFCDNPARDVAQGGRRLGGRPIDSENVTHLRAQFITGLPGVRPALAFGSPDGASESLLLEDIDRFRDGVASIVR